MSNLGIGVMIGMLACNDESAKAMRSAIGKKIASLAVVDNSLRVGLDDGRMLTLLDDGQSCCEARYMSTDDDLSYYVGAELRGAEVRDAPSVESDDNRDSCHDVQFLAVQTDRGEFVLANHNEHNGYYGGFLIRASVE